VATAAVIGGGPAGLMAAQRLAEGGVNVTVYDQMPSVGRKFLLAGRSGLNLTHSEPLADFVQRYGSRTARMSPLLRAFTPEQLRSWSDSLGVATSLGSSGRVFPDSVRATPLLRAWLSRLDELGVIRRTGHRWLGWTDDGKLSFSVTTTRAEPPQLFDADHDAVVLALGGASWPRTGSEGSWVHALRTRGLDVSPLMASNCGLLVAWTPAAAAAGGTPLKNVVVSHDGVSVRGEAVMTRSGLEGGAIYAIGATVRASLSIDQSATVVFDLHPDLSHDQLAQRLQVRRAGDTMRARLQRAKLGPGAIVVLRESCANQLPHDPAALAALVKHAPITVIGTAPIERAISSDGGLSMDELDDHLMVRSLPGVFACGEMLDWDAPTGGYLLQACFASGHAAGLGAVEWLAR
jgi:uncharacterized flavoprotein (TIGR03862 family)